MDVKKWKQNENRRRKAIYGFMTYESIIIMVLKFTNFMHCYALEITSFSIFAARLLFLDSLKNRSLFCKKKFIYLKK